jgi:RNAse (barnase) inhibitor barstar
MEDWLDLTELIPGLEKGQWLHVVNSPLNPLVKRLSDNGFSVYVINGADVTDSQSFFTQVKSVFKFPDYFNGGWPAWDDCLGDFACLVKGKTAIVWEKADQSFQSDSATFMQAVFDLYSMALYAGHIDQPDPCQVELFLLGDSEGFKNILNFPDK